MDFVLTDEQIAEYISRCVNEKNKNKDNDSKIRFKILNYDLPEVTIRLFSKDLNNPNILTFANDNVYCKNAPICKNMQEIYLEYMYELFGDEYLTTLESNMIEYIDAEKHRAQEKYIDKSKELEDMLKDYLSLINRTKETSLKQ